MPNTSNPQTPATCEPMLTKTQPASDLKLPMEHRMRKSGTACKRCLCQAPPKHSNTLKMVARDAFAKRLRNTQTPGMRKSGTAPGFEPNAHKKTPVKVLRVTFGSTTNLWKNGLSKIRAQRTRKNTSKSTTNLWKNGLKKPKPCQTLATLKHQQLASPCSPKRSPLQI